MKKALLTAALTATALCVQAQTWQPTHLTSVNYLPIVMENHHEQLYATVFNSVTASLNRLNTGNTTWSTITTPSDITVPRFMKSAGSRLYVSTVNGGVYSMLYYTTDGGATFTIDTAGLPKYISGVALIRNVQYFKGKVIVAMSGDGYYIKDTAGTVWQSINPPTAFNAPMDPLTYYNDTLYGYDNSGARVLYASGNWGTTWNAVTTNLPVDFATHVLEADDVTGRLYAAGGWNNATQYGLKYSDNRGITWADATTAAPFLGTNYLHTQQQVTAMYAHEPVIYLAMENNKDGSAPDIVGSMTGLANLAYDTAGLPGNAGGVVNGIKFQLYQGKLALCLNVTDVYLKGESNAVAEPPQGAAEVELHPNPATNVLHLSAPTSQAVKTMRIMDYTGRTVWSANGYVSTVPVAALRPGLYIVQLACEDGSTASRQFVKN